MNNNFYSFYNLFIRGIEKNVSRFTSYSTIIAPNEQYYLFKKKEEKNVS